MGAGGESSFPDRAVVSRLVQSAEEILRSLLRPGSRAALLDFPTYANVGDSAIWIGTRRLLGRLGVRIVYMADVDNYSPARLARRLPHGTILLQGGGNFGDLFAARNITRPVGESPTRGVARLAPVALSGASRR